MTSTEEHLLIVLAGIRDAHDSAARNRRKWRYAAAAGIFAFVVASYLIKQ